MRLPLHKRHLARAILPALALTCLHAARAASQPCGTPATPIAEIQGGAAASPLAGRVAEVQTIVTADAIAVGLLYNASTAIPAGRAATTWLGERSRQPLAGTFRATAGGTPVTLVVNHFKSKNCMEAAGAQADQGDGQGCWNPARLQAAEALTEWLGATPTGYPAQACS